MRLGTGLAHETFKSFLNVLGFAGWVGLLLESKQRLYERLLGRELPSPKL